MSYTPLPSILWELLLNFPKMLILHNPYKLYHIGTSGDGLLRFKDECDSFSKNKYLFEQTAYRKNLNKGPVSFMHPHQASARRKLQKFNKCLFLLREAYLKIVVLFESVSWLFEGYSVLFGLKRQGRVFES